MDSSDTKDNIKDLSLHGFTSVNIDIKSIGLWMRSQSWHGPDL